MVKRVISITLLLLIILVGYLQKDNFLLSMKAGGASAGFFSMLLVAICVFFPILPFPVLAGGIGAVFGAAQGVLISLTGAMAGTMCFFFLTRYGFRDMARVKLQKYERIQQFEVFLERNAFTAILVSRLVPVVPAPVVNTICGLSEVNWFTFFAASTIGKLPNILILSFAGASFTSNKLFSFGLYGLYIFILFLINLVIIYRRKIKKIKSYD